MASESGLSLSIELALIIFLLLLLLDDAEELISLSLGLGGHQDLFLNELPLSNLIQLNCLFALQLRLLNLFTAGFTLAIFESSLGSECIDLTLTISCALLKLSETLDFELLLCLDALGLRCSRFFFGDAISVVPDDCQIFFALFACLLLLAVQSDSV